MAKQRMIYISGPITGRPQDETWKKFSEVVQMIRRDSNLIPINPLHFAISGLTYKKQMKLDIAILTQCDAIYMLEGWDDSKGACTEHSIAKTLGLMVFYDSDYKFAKKHDDVLEVDLESLKTAGRRDY